jgi:hypothetical protein
VDVHALAERLLRMVEKKSMTNLSQREASVAQGVRLVSIRAYDYTNRLYTFAQELANPSHLRTWE